MREVEHPRVAARVHRVGEHEPAGTAGVRRLAYDDAGSVRLAAGRPRHDMPVALEVRHVVARLQRHERLEHGAGTGDFRGHGRQWCRDGIRRQVLRRRRAAGRPAPPCRPGAPCPRPPCVGMGDCAASARPFRARMPVTAGCRVVAAGVACRPLLFWAPAGPANQDQPRGSLSKDGIRIPPAACKRSAASGGRPPWTVVGSPSTIGRPF